MYDRLIVASAERESLDGWRAVAEIIHLKLAPDARLTGCLDLDQLRLVWDQRTDSRDLLLIELNLPNGSLSSSAKDGPPALDFVETIQTSDHPSDCILIGDADLEVQARVSRLPRCRLLHLAEPRAADCIPIIEGYARQLVEGRPATPNDVGDEWALIDVNVYDGDTSFVKLYTGRGNHSVASAPEPLRLDLAKLEAVIQRSRDLRRDFSAQLADPGARDRGNWQREYRSLGEELYELLNQWPFIEAWGEARGMKKSHRRLRFTLGERAYDALWEAICQPSANRRPWMMLESTISRRLRAAENPKVRPLDCGDGIVHVLVVLADCKPKSFLEGPEDLGWHAVKRGLVDRAETRLGRMPKDASEIFPELDNLEDELRVLQLLEQPIDGRTPRFKVDFLRSGDAADGAALVDRLRETLTEGEVPAGRKYRYDIVHFAGHAVFGEDVHDSGYLILGDAGVSYALPIAEFADWLRESDVQLAYLSCCSSSASRAAMELAHSGVPLAIGFAWDLETRKAVAFARKFYGHLLKNDLKICQAFHKARNELHRHYQERDSIWAAPVLVAQPESWEMVETCFTQSGTTMH